jgi:choline kinase
MTAIILAAGRSTRLYPLTRDIPKCLLHVGDRTILDRTIDAVRCNGVNSLLIIVGFEKEKIIAHIHDRWPDLAIRCVENPDYAVTNNAASLLCARSAVGSDDVLLLDSDIVFDPEILRIMVDAPYGACCALRTGGTIGAEEIKIELGEGTCIRRIGKEITLARSAGESVGIEKFSSAAMLRLFQTLEQRILVEQRKEEFYEASFQQMIDEGMDFRAIDIGPLNCIEVDTESDLREARSMFDGMEDLQ